MSKPGIFTGIRKALRASINTLGGFNKNEEYEVQRTQFPGSKKTAICDVVIGLDFGTSCTKVVLRTPYLHNNRALAVPFTDLTPSKNPYLLPSKVWLNPDQEFLLREEKDCQCFSGIKLSLIERRQEWLNNSQVDSHEDFSPPKLAVVYLALVLRFAREWFLSTKKDIYGDFKLRWHANLGLPSIEYDSSHLSELYDRILHAAWMLSLQDEGIRNTNPSNAFDGLLGSRWNKDTLDDVHLRVIPEVAAAVSGYARSPLRDPGMPGLHLLVDIGAGTLDVCGFILHQKEGDDCYSLLKADVQLLGVIKLHENRLSMLNEGMGETWDLYDTDFSIPSDIKNYLPSHSTPEAQEKLRKADENFSERCQQSIKKTIHDIRMKRDPNSPCWQNSLPVFICGGGLNVPFYQEMVLKKISTWLRGWLRNEEGLKTYTLPKPENLELEFSDDYHRLAVAHGLSIPADDIGTIDPTQSSEDINPENFQTSDYESKFISKDMV